MSLLTMRRALPAALVALLLLFGALGVAYAAGSASVQDNAGFFRPAAVQQIKDTAQKAGLKILVITNKQSFQSHEAWYSWVKDHASDADTITIGIHHYPNTTRQDSVYVVPGKNTNISLIEANGEVSPSNFRGTDGFVNGTVQLINQLKSDGATAGNSASGSSAGWLIPVIVIAALLFLVFRVFGGRRRRQFRTGTPPGYGNRYPQQYGNPNQNGYPNQNSYPNQYPNQYGPGPYQQQRGGAGRSFLGGLAGGIAGAAIGDALFDRDRGDASASFDNGGNDGSQETLAGQDASMGFGDNSGGWDGGGGDSGGWDSGGDSGGFDSGGGGDSGGSW